MRTIVVFASLASLLLSPADARRGFMPRVPAGHAAAARSGAQPSVANCTLHHLAQPLDHFSFDAPAHDTTFRQRVFVADAHWRGAGSGAPVWLYVGNEADVELYVNASGLMWENAAAAGALLVFAEHRYYGGSLPFGPGPGGSFAPGRNISFLTHEQALADYAALISAMRGEAGGGGAGALNPAAPAGAGALAAYGADASSPVFAFGGSYGGELAAWARMKYPHLVEGAIAASAPLLGTGDLQPWASGATPHSYFGVVSRNCGPEGGSPAACRANVGAVWPLLDAAAATASGRASLAAAFGLCRAPADAAGAAMLRYWIRDAFDEMSMGNYPWPSTYISGEFPLPAFPVRVACAGALGAGGTYPSAALPDAAALFRAVRDAAGVLYNASGAVACFELPTYPTPATAGAPMDGTWDYQWCTQLLSDSYWFATLGGAADMFWEQPFNASFVRAHCAAAWGTAPDAAWVGTSYGRGAAALGRGKSNIVFSNGGFDPWSSGGVLANLTTAAPGADLVVVSIPTGAHHLDLMFAHDDDPPALAAARAAEVGYLAKWARQYAVRWRRQQQQQQQQQEL